MKELNQQQMGGKDVAYYDDKHYLDMVLQLLGTRGRLMILMILMQVSITWTMVVEPPGTGGRRQFSGLPRPRLPRVTWNYGEPRGASENI